MAFLMKGFPFPVSTTGYKRNSPDVDNEKNIIPSNDITMKGVDFKVKGTGLAKVLAVASLRSSRLVRKTALFNDLYKIFGRITFSNSVILLINCLGSNSISAIAITSLYQ